MALRKAWQKMKRTLSSKERQSLVTSELWEIFQAKDHLEVALAAEDSRQKMDHIRKIQLMKQKNLEMNLAMRRYEISSKIKASNEKGNLQILLNGLSPYYYLSFQF
jgi:hypothetical protein